MKYKWILYSSSLYSSHINKYRWKTGHHNSSMQTFLHWVPQCNSIMLHCHLPQASWVLYLFLPTEKVTIDIDWYSVWSERDHSCSLKIDEVRKEHLLCYKLIGNHLNHWCWMEFPRSNWKSTESLILIGVPMFNVSFNLYYETKKRKQRNKIVQLKCTIPVS